MTKPYRLPWIEAVTEVARFYARRDFTVAGRSIVKGCAWRRPTGPSRPETVRWSAARPWR